MLFAFECRGDFTAAGFYRIIPFPDQYDMLLLRLAVEFLGSEPKFAEPTARPEGAVRCTAAKLVSDPNNSFAPNLLSI